MRADAGLARSSFRLSEAWRRRSGTGELTPEIDARLAGVEKRGDQLVVHSLSGNERNHYFSNRGGKTFTDISALSGLDNPADGRGWALLDYDRDGWQDLALVNANEPLFNLYRNRMPAAGIKGGVIAVKFVGGNRTPQKSPMTCRDGYGAVLTANLGDTVLTREHRCGDGFAAQHTAVMFLGLGTRPAAAEITVRWPSGKSASLKNVAEGTLLTCFENPGDSPDGTGFASAPWRVESKDRPARAVERPLSDFAAADTGGKPETRLRVYTSMATWCAACATHLPLERHIASELASEPIEFIGVPTDETEDETKLTAYAKAKKVPYRLLTALPPPQRALFTNELGRILGSEPGLPSSMITDGSGRVITALPGIPTLSQLRRLLSEQKPVAVR